MPHDEDIGLVQRTADESNAEPIFLLGCPRSGTTLLRWILDTHPRIHCPPETYFLFPLLDMYRQSIRHVPRDLGLGPHALNAYVRNLVCAIHGDLATRAGKARWVDKTPQYSLIAEFICTLFEGRCKFIIAVRHGIDVACSMAERIETGNWLDLGDASRFRKLGLPMPNQDIPLFAGAEIWATYSEHLGRFKALHPELCHVVSYERLATAPEPTVADLFRFLAEPVDAGLLSRTFELEHGKGTGDSKILATAQIESNRVGRWRTLSPEVLQQLARIVNSQLECWNYEKVH